MATPTPYCTRDDLERRASIDGVALRLDDYSGGDATTAVSACIEEATVEINNYCLLCYDVPALLASDWVRMKTIRLAIYYLCLRRLNKAPASVEKQREEVLKDLDRVRMGRLDIADTYKSHSSAPGLVNQRVVLQPVPSLVTVNARSIGSSGGNYPSHADPLDI